MINSSNGSSSNADPPLVYMSKLQMVPNENLRQIGLRFEEEKFYVEKDEELLKYVP